MSFVFVYRLYLDSSMGVSGVWPYSAQKNDSPTSRRSHCMYPVSRTLRADTLPLLNGNDVVSQPVKACMPSN